MKSFILVDPAKIVCAHSVNRPSRIPDMASVMMSGLTWNTPTPMPLAAPATTPTSSAPRMATRAPVGDWLAAK